MTTVGQLCKRSVAIARPAEPLRDAAARMRDEHVGTVIVVDEQDGRKLPVGILTDRDIVVVVLARTDRHLGSIHVGEIMSPELITASDDEDVGRAWGRMQAYGVRRLPVLDATGNLVGILSVDDLLDYLADAGRLDELAQLIKRERVQELHMRP